MKTKRHIVEAIAMLLALCFAFALVLRNGGTASGYPAGPTPTPSHPQGLVPRAYLPLVDKNYPLPQPPGYWTETEYVDTTSSLPDLAMSLGITDSNPAMQPDRIMVLDFGGQFQSGGQWGTYQIFSSTFDSHAQIVSTVFNVALNYWEFTGNARASHLTIGVGTNNAYISDGQPATDRGNEWAGMVNEINQNIASYDVQNSADITSQVTVLGANDIEDWGTYPATSTWMQAYMNTSSCIPGSYENKCLVDFGNSAGCTAIIGSTNETCNGGWTVGDVLLMGSAIQRTNDVYRFIVTVPEIYDTGGTLAHEWANVSLWGVNHGYQPIWFAGTLTQWTRCQDLGVNCGTLNAKPSTGWCELQAALTTRDEITQLAFRWMTDINRQKYAGQSQPGIQQCP